MKSIMMAQRNENIKISEPFKKRGDADRPASNAYFSSVTFELGKHTITFGFTRHETQHRVSIKMGFKGI